MIWGRFDCVVDGEVELDEAVFQRAQPDRPQGNPGSRQPRTALGIDRDGKRLYLLVVDGRQPRFSMGASRLEVGMLLKPFGVHEAMLCDEGNSSYLQVRARARRHRQLAERRPRARDLHALRSGARSQATARSPRCGGAGTVRSLSRAFSGA